MVLKRVSWLLLMIVPDAEESVHFRVMSLIGYGFLFSIEIDSVTKTIPKLFCVVCDFFTMTLSNVSFLVYE